jgi:Flp pilus assembly protein TadG
MMKTRSKKTNQDGVAAVEFAIILPFLVILIFGMIEFSLVLFNKAMITNASRGRGQG